MDYFGEKKAKPLALIMILAVLPVLDYLALSYIYEYLYADVAYVTF